MHLNQINHHVQRLSLQCLVIHAVPTQYAMRPPLPWRAAPCSLAARRRPPPLSRPCACGSMDAPTRGRAVGVQQGVRHQLKASMDVTSLLPEAVGRGKAERQPSTLPIQHRPASQCSCAEVSSCSIKTWKMCSWAAGATFRQAGNIIGKGTKHAHSHAERPAPAPATDIVGRGSRAMLIFRVYVI